jgi:hypothetical protein
MKGKGRAKTLVNSDTKKKTGNNKLQRLCSAAKCKKQVQRKGLCTRHLTENTNQRQQSERSSAPSPTSKSGTDSDDGTITDSPPKCASEEKTSNEHSKCFV